MTVSHLLPAGTSWPGSGLRGKAILTYDNTRMTDGAGAQLQRIYGIYAVARLVGAAYAHTPIARIDYQGFSSLRRNVLDPDFQRPFNDLFQIASDVTPGPDLHRMALPNISVEAVGELAAAFDAGRTGGAPTLVQVVVPYGIADRFPDCYEVCRDLSPFRATVCRGRPMRIAMHVRRGELLVVESHRMLPNAYYVRTAQHLAEMLEARGIDYQIELHTETADRDFVVPAGYPGPLHRAASAVVRLEMNLLDDFDALPHLVRCLNDGAIDCLRKLATADVLIMSRSSFSYVAAILNRAGIVLCYPFWHSALSSWVKVDLDGQFDPATFIAGLQRMVDTPAD